ncbi:MAG: hypothetical protein OEV42_06225 [Deltaproteobacteria bacterium]|nr:hypothetical protein [Deltaproteobacteria bacterium]
MKKYLIIALLIFLVGACSKKPDPSPVTYHKKGNLYENNYFGFTVEKPEGWYARDVKESLFLQQHKKAPSGKTDEREMKAAVQEAIEKTLPLFSFFEFRHGSQLKVNPSVLSVAQNMKNFPEAKTACDYLKHVIAVLERGQIAYTFDQNCETSTFNGREYDTVNAYAKVGKDIVYQRYYATISGKHAISIIVNYFNDETKMIVEKFMSSIKFKS